MNNWKYFITLLFLGFEILVFPKIAISQNSLTSNSYIYASSSSSDLARMYTNLIMKNRDWSNILESSINEYFLSLEGTSNEIPTRHRKHFTKIITQKFPEFYKNTFTQAILNTTDNKKFIFLLYCSAAGMKLTHPDILYLRKNYEKINFENSLEMNFRYLYRKEMRIWAKSLLK